MRNEKIFDSLAWRLHKAGVRPNQLTFLQAPLLGALVATVLLNDMLAFGVVQALVIIVDGADGILARRTGSVTRRGHLLDSVFDILGIGITLWAVSYLYPTLTQWAFALLLVNFIVYVQNEIQGTKSVTYTRGPATIGLFLQPYFPEAVRGGQPTLMFMGLLLPLAYGALLTVTRVEWRKRLWNWYQFFTAGRRREYKATARRERAALTRLHAGLPPRKTEPEVEEGHAHKPSRQDLPRERPEAGAIKNHR